MTVDLHVHLDHGLTLPRALELSLQRGVRFGIVEHGGRGRSLANDDDLRAYLHRLDGHSVYRGMQAEGRDWMCVFSAHLVDQLDYVLTDALTFTDPQAGLIQLWRANACLNMDRVARQRFMQRYVDLHVQILTDEPIDILANPTFLPASLADEYEVLWTTTRIQRVIDAARAKGVALEINSRYCVPSPLFIGMAKAAGCRFAFGSNHHGEDVGKLAYCEQMATQFDLTAQDLFQPRDCDAGPIPKRRV